MNDEPEVLPVVREPEPVSIAPASLFGSADPDEAMSRMTKVAGVLAKAVRAQGLTNNIQGKEYVRVEGWTLLGSLLGVYPAEVKCEVVPGSETAAGHDWQATVTVRTRDGAAVGSAVALCCRSEKRWSTADEYAVASMAQTRATAKALRLPLGFVMKLAGYETTPSEEMPSEPKGGRSTAGGEGQPVAGTAASPARGRSEAKQAAGGAGAHGPGAGSPARGKARKCPTCAGVGTVFENRDSHKLFCSMRYGGCGAEWLTREAWDAAQPPAE